ncbi:MAG: DeoR/GlpR transcriptional regulator [Bacteroidetes bacterium]|nr:MAG: DeoR/GlpR transcriptional regulator [Bacteroidota bacterium]
MLKVERQQQILDWLQKEKKVLLSEISSALKVSEDTIRRDIKELSAKRLLQEVRGGAVPQSPGPRDLKERTLFASQDKKTMARKAIKLLQKGQVIILDGGTSTLAIAVQIPRDWNLTVITNSFPVVNLLEDRNDIELFFAGGRLFRESFLTTGHDATGFFQNIRADICFLGVSSIDLNLGLTGHHYDECALKKAMIKSSNQVVALSTPEKLNTTEAFHICPLQALTGLITPKPDIELLAPYKKAGVNVI